MRSSLSAIAFSVLAAASVFAADPSALTRIEQAGRTQAVLLCPGCDLSEVWLQDGEIARGSDLSGADLTGARLARTKLRRAPFAQFRGIIRNHMLEAESAAGALNSPEFTDYLVEVGGVELLRREHRRKEDTSTS